jgi:Flp pilus assembly protein TadD
MAVVPPRSPLETDELGPLSSEEFLFHLSRGAELLRNGQVHEAKAAIESALRMQPSDPQGQDLLGAVYFKLGICPLDLCR